MLHPVYSGVARSRLERIRVGRKYGKYDFGRFDRLAGSSYYLGKGSIGEMEVACNFLFTESKWGILSQAQNPGGVVYLDLVFTEPPGCRLRGATVLLSLDEEDEDLRRYFAADKPRKPHVPVQIIEHGPQKLHGEMREVLKATRKFFTPQVNAGGFGGFGGVGRESEQQELKSSQWRLSSHPLPNHLGRPTTLRWDLSENELDLQPRHNNKFHTAFAFEHDGQPFFMQVEVSGHLESTTSHLRHKVKQRFKRFKFPSEPQSATTLVNFGGRNNAYKTPLDELVKAIPLQMVLKNMKQVPQVPGTRTENKPLFQVTAETEEVTTNGEGMDMDHPGPLYVTNSLTSEETAELRAQAISVSLLGQPQIGFGLRGEEEQTSVQINTGDNLSLSDDNHDNNHQIADLADLAESMVQNQNGHIQQSSRYKDIESLLQETHLPLMIQLIILWLMSFGIKSSSSSIQTSTPGSNPGQLESSTATEWRTRQEELGATLQQVVP